MGGETLGGGGGGGGRFLSLVPSSIFLIVAIIQLFDGLVARVKKREFRSSEEYQLRQEIKQLLNEATLLSTPSTFAQAAKLRRAAAAKEKELLKSM
ncbi:hypothetical protein Taro_019087 [Colocasia esculenta]|uniref:Uncharacterized protein n=1 Tax=Colocasia esculenta TaxID=4460 RepID=A0A843USW5_COLES|nr:hypothetical protein [Colocasia esculenta]